MTLRSGIYIVPTHRWYIERTVWLIAGFVLLVSTALAALVDPRWVLLVIATGLASIAVALTGFCIVGNVLHLLGFTPMLGRSGPTPANLYFMQTDSWYLERRIYLAVGINISVASVLSLVHSTWWLLFTGFVGTAMVWFAATGYCIMANSLYWLAAEPRLAPERNATRDVGLGTGIAGVRAQSRHRGELGERFDARVPTRASYSLVLLRATRPRCSTKHVIGEVTYDGAKRRRLR